MWTQNKQNGEKSKPLSGLYFFQHSLMGRLPSIPVQVTKVISKGSEGKSP